MPIGVHKSLVLKLLSFCDPVGVPSAVSADPTELCSHVISLVRNIFLRSVRGSVLYVNAFRGHWILVPSKGGKRSEGTQLPQPSRGPRLKDKRSTVMSFTPTSIWQAMSMEPGFLRVIVDNTVFPQGF